MLISLGRTVAIIWTELFSLLIVVIPDLVPTETEVGFWLVESNTLNASNSTFAFLAASDLVLVALTVIVCLPYSKSSLENIVTCLTVDEL